MIDIQESEIRRILSERVALYRWHEPTYQIEMLKSFAQLWPENCDTVVDVGGGTGIVAQVICELFSVTRVVAIDVIDRFLSKLDIETKIYDGKRIPFRDGEFGCAVLTNVIHHIPHQDRVRVLGECARTTDRGPILIKDHLAVSAGDHVRLAMLDAMGNLPFGGMLAAQYIEQREWENLATKIGYRIERMISGRYRSGLFSKLFPNRLEVMMRWVSAENHSGGGVISSNLQ